MNSLSLTPQQQALLQAIANNQAESERLRKRARLLLDLQAGLASKQIANKLGLSERSVRYWRQLFMQRGMDIFQLSHTADEMDRLQETNEQKKVVKKTKTPQVEKKDKMQLAGIKIFSFCFKQICAHEDGTRKGEDIEELHDMRVATRRLRAAMRLFSPFFSKKILKRTQRKVKILGQTLGKVRDLDVFMERAKQELMELEGIAPEEHLPLIGTWEEEHAAARQALVEYLDSEEYQEFVKDFSAFLEEFKEEDDDDSTTKEMPKPIRVEEWLPILIYQQFAEVRAFDPIIEKATFEQLHALRRAFKMFRYTLEFFCDVLSPEETRYIINQCKQIQDHLGELNDAHNACLLIAKYKTIVEERQNNLLLTERQNPSVFLAYLIKKEEQRYNLASKFAEAWRSFMSSAIKQNLAQAVSVL
jgi:CHAD domain-containing protein/DNA-binding CsgD family transcriptional regulator